MAEEVILYDIPTKAPRGSWSPNPGKTRLLLNYKKIPYKTEWVEYPDIRPQFEGRVEPNTPDIGAEYTCPAVLINGKLLMDSKKIAIALEDAFPSAPTLDLDSPYQAKIQAVLPKVAGPLVPVWMPGVPPLLASRSAEYFERTRTENLGLSFPDLIAQRGGEQAWEKAAPGLEELLALYREHPEGPFLQGKQVVYADFYILAWLKFLERLGPQTLQKAFSFGPEFKTLLDAGDHWFAKND